LIGVVDAKHQDTDAYDCERKQRPDADEFSDQPDRQNACQTTDDRAGADRRDVGCPETRVRGCETLRQQAVMGDCAKDA
jgi:hypothetical protein